MKRIMTKYIITYGVIRSIRGHDSQYKIPIANTCQLKAEADYSNHELSI